MSGLEGAQTLPLRLLMASILWAKMPLSHCITMLAWWGLVPSCSHQHLCPTLHQVWPSWGGRPGSPAAHDRWTGGMKKGPNFSLRPFSSTYTITLSGDWMASLCHMLRSTLAIGWVAHSILLYSVVDMAWQSDRVNQALSKTTKSSSQQRGLAARKSPILSLVTAWASVTLWTFWILKGVMPRSFFVILFKVVFVTGAACLRADGLGCPESLFAARSSFCLTQAIMAGLSTVTLRRPLPQVGSSTLSL